MSEVIKASNVDGAEMGVLEDGTPFLTARGLALFCGVSSTAILGWGENVPKEGDNFRAGKMAELLAANGFKGDNFFDKVIYDGNEANAYYDTVCMAFLEYYAFEAGKRSTEEAKNNYRVLARKTLKDFIYRMTGYDPRDIVPFEWRHFHDRMILNPVPVGYFSVFREIADIIVSAIQEGLVMDSRTVPDISVGKIWSKYWTANKLSETYGERTKYPHEYPPYFPQARANENIEAYIYPVDALGEFRKWFQVEYLSVKFSNYLKRKVKEELIPATSADLLLKAVQPIELNPSEEE